MCFYVTEQFQAAKCQNKQDKQVTVTTFPKGRKTLAASAVFSICSEVTRRKKKNITFFVANSLKCTTGHDFSRKIQAASIKKYSYIHLFLYNLESSITSTLESKGLQVKMQLFFLHLSIPLSVVACKKGMSLGRSKISGLGDIMRLSRGINFPSRFALCSRQRQRLCYHFHAWLGYY